MKKPGSGLEVVNINDLKAVIGQNEIIKISMAYQKDIADYRKQIYKVGKTTGEKKLDESQKKIIEELASLRKKDDKNINRIEFLEKELQKIGEQKRNIDFDAQELAIIYTPINLDDASDVLRKSFKMFQNGALDSALNLLSTINLVDQANTILDRRHKRGEIRKELARQESIDDINAKNTIEQVQFKAYLYKLSYQFDSASNYYKLLTRLDTLDGSNFFNYAFFLEWLNKYDEAITYYKIALTLFENSPKVALPLNNMHIGSIKNNLGILYKLKNEVEKSINYFLDCILLYNQMARAEPETYLIRILSTMDNLASLYANQNNFGKADSVWKESLKIINSLEYLTFQEEYRFVIAGIYNNWAQIYKIRGQYIKAEELCLKALAEYRILTRLNPSSYRSYVSSTLGNLAILSTNRGNYTKAKEYYFESISILRELREKNFYSFEPALAKGLHNLGYLYMDLEEFENAERAFLEAISVWRQLSLQDSVVHKADIAGTLINLSSLYRFHGKLEMAKNTCIETLNIYKEFASINSEKYLPFLIDTYNELGTIYVYLKKYNDAEQNFWDAHRNCLQSFTFNENIFRLKLAQTELNLGILFRRLERFDEAESCLSSSNKNYELLKNNDSSYTYNNDVAELNYNLGIVYFELNKKEDAEIAYVKAIEKYRQLRSPRLDHLMINSVNNLLILYQTEGKKNKMANLLNEEISFEFHAMENESKKLYRRISFLQFWEGIFYWNDRDISKAEIAYLGVIDNYRRVGVTNDSWYKLIIAKALNNLGFLYADKLEYEKAKSAYLEAIELCKDLPEANQKGSGFNVEMIKVNLSKIANKF